MSGNDLSGGDMTKRRDAVILLAAAVAVLVELVVGSRTTTKANVVVVPISSISSITIGMQVRVVPKQNELSNRSLFMFVYVLYSNMLAKLVYWGFFDCVSLEVVFTID